MFKNLIVFYIIIVLTICSKTIDCLKCYSCGSSTSQCQNKNRIVRVRCGTEYDSCGVAFQQFDNGTSIVYSAFCYSKLDETDCIKSENYEYCKETCQEDFCNDLNKNYFKKEETKKNDDVEYLPNVNSDITTPNLNQISGNEANTKLFNFYLVLFCLFVTIYFLK